MDRSVQIKNVHFSYHESDHILKNISLEIYQNEIVSLLGPSGSGKSTLLNLVAGFYEASSGEIMINQKVVKSPGSDRGVVFQDLALFPWLTVQKNVEFGLKMQGTPKEDRSKKAQVMIGMVGLHGYENVPIQSLSGGMRQRVALARTLVTEPEVLLMDEPFSALDAQTRDVLQEELLKIHTKINTTTLLVTHSIDEAIYLSDRVVLLSKSGEIKHIERIDIDRPRDRTSEFYNKYQRSFYELLKEEQMQKVGNK